MPDGRTSTRGITYLADGEGTAGTALLLHSLGTDRHLWDGVAPLLVEAGLRVLVPDSRGHGATAVPMDGDQNAWVGDLVGLLDEEQVDTCHLVGVSMGAAQALELALAAPDRIGRMVLAGAFGSLPTEEAAAKAEGLSRGAAEHGLAAWADRYAKGTLCTTDEAAHASLRRSISSMTLDDYVASARACFAARSAPVSRIGTVTLVVCGELDVKTPRAMAVALAEELANARVVDLSGAGHLPPLDRPLQFASLVLDHVLTGADGALEGASPSVAQRMTP